MFAYTFHPLGDCALTIQLGDEIDEGINDRVQNLFYQLKHQKLEFVIDIIPAYASLTVVYDTMKVNRPNNSSAYEVVEEALNVVINKNRIDYTIEKRLVEIPVCYEMDCAPDLISLATEKQMPADEIVQLHLATTYRVYMIGFLPGFAYMGKVDDKIATPRKSIPDQKILAGSVGIAGNQTGIYPFNSPGGWNIVGRTPIKIFDVNNKEPCLFSPGDQVRFVPITIQEFDKLNQHQ